MSGGYIRIHTGRTETPLRELLSDLHIDHFIPSPTNWSALFLIWPINSSSPPALRDLRKGAR